MFWHILDAYIGLCSMFFRLKSNFRNCQLMKILICSNKIAEVKYNTKNKIIFANYHGIIEYDLAEEVIKSINQVAVNNGINGAIADISKLRGSFYRLMEYMANEGFPLLIKHGLRVYAQVISEDIIIHNLSNKVNNIGKELGIESKIFNDNNKAEEWVKWVLKKK